MSSPRSPLTAARLSRIAAWNKDAAGRRPVRCWQRLPPGHDVSRRDGVSAVANPVRVVHSEASGYEQRGYAETDAKIGIVQCRQTFAPNRREAEHVRAAFHGSDKIDECRRTDASQTRRLPPVLSFARRKKDPTAQTRHLHATVVEHRMRTSRDRPRLPRITCGPEIERRTLRHCGASA